MLLEHLADPVTLHENVRRMLVPGGHAVHFFPRCGRRRSS